MSKQHDYPNKASAKVGDNRSTKEWAGVKSAKPAKDKDKLQTIVQPGASTAGKPGQKA
ncbi:MAG TPA: hypothetical protein PKZ76_17180 [Xanthomonadaceae bacterium]|nr:hypothetical protein [Xanthomonadaceae bacterium]